jgi:hypothetical protein
MKARLRVPVVRRGLFVRAQPATRSRISRDIQIEDRSPVTLAREYQDNEASD